MKKLKRILSLTLVIAVLMTSMLVSTVGAVDASESTKVQVNAGTNPMQTVLIQALALVNDKNQKDLFLDALAKGDVKAIMGIFPTIQKADVEEALAQYGDLSSVQKAAITIGVSSFDLKSIPNKDVAGFSTIAAQVNKGLTGSSDSNNYGIGLITGILQFINTQGENGAYAIDLPSDTSKIKFEYYKNQNIELAIGMLEELIGSMETLNNKIKPYNGATSFDKLLAYTADLINKAPKSEIKSLKAYLYSVDSSLYPQGKPSDPGNSGGSTSGGGGGGGSSTTNTPSTPVNDPTKAISDANKTIDSLVKPTSTANVAEVAKYEQALKAAITKAIETVGTTTVAPKVTGTTATITADQIKVADLLAKADAVVKTADELAKKTTGTNVAVEKKLVLDVSAKNVDKVNVALPSELLTKVQSKGIQTIEIVTGDVKLSIAPDFAAAAKSSSSIALEVNKVTVTDDLKAKMTDEQKAILAGNATVYDFNATSIAANGTKTKISSFDKSVKIKIKYTLKAGENKDNITVLFLGDDGKIQNMAGKYNEATGEVEFTTSHFSTYVVKSLVKSFDDVAAGTWYKSQVDSLTAKGIAEAREGNNFEPNANITRAEFMKMLVLAKGVYDENATCDFTDVSKDSKYYSYVASAVNAGIAAGTGNNKFNPDSLITREQMAVMLANTMGIKTVENASTYLNASDASKISSYATNGMALCVKNGFISGVGNNKLDPKGTATRGMAAVVVYKYFNF